MTASVPIVYRAAHGVLDGAWVDAPWLAVDDRGLVIATGHAGDSASAPPPDAVQRDRLDVARAFAVSHRVHVVLKGHRTLVVTPAGNVSIAQGFAAIDVRRFVRRPRPGGRRPRFPGPAG